MESWLDISLVFFGFDVHLFDDSHVLLLLFRLVADWLCGRSWPLGA
jgi:hypothetical protein